MLCLPLEAAVDPSVAGQKAARLATVVDLLPVPEAYVVVAENFRRHIEKLPIPHLLSRLDMTNWESILDTSEAIRRVITRKPIEEGFISSLKLLLKDKTWIAVRSSSVQEDLPGLSFAGIYDSFLDTSVANIENAIKLCWASVYSPRALSYRHHNRLSHDNVSMAVMIQDMIQGVSGVLLTANPNTGAKETLIEFHADGVVQGKQEPHRLMMTFPLDVTLDRDLPKYAQTFLYRYGEILEKIFRSPMDVEWIFDGKHLHILQARPLTVLKKKGDVPSHVSAFPILIGSPIGEGLLTGVVQKVQRPGDPFKRGNILVVETTSPEWEPVMRQAKALITDKGSQTSHASLVAREMGLHAMVGTMDATRLLSDGQTVTLDGNDLYTGFVYGGAVKPKDEDNQDGRLQEQHDSNQGAAGNDTEERH